MEGRTGRALISIVLNVVILIVAVAIIYTIGSRAFAFGANVFDEKGMTSAENAIEVEVTVPVNASSDKIADILFKKGLIADKTVFKVQVMLSDYKGKFQAGTYTVNTAMTPTELMQTLCAMNTESDE